MLDNQQNEVPAWNSEKKLFTIAANLRCDYCGDNFQMERVSSKRILGGVETEDEVLKGIQTGAQTKHFKCYLKAQKSTIKILNYSRKNIK